MSCILCGSTIQRASDYVNLEWSDLTVFDNLAIFVCQACGLGAAYPRIPSIRLFDFYKNHYRRKGSPFHLDFVGLQESTSLSLRAIAQISLISVFRDFVVGSRILDIGAGAGHSFAALRQAQEKLELFAIEPAKDAADFYSQKFGVRSYGSLGDCRVQNQLFDVVIMSHVLEHFNSDDVLPFLRELHSLVPEDGLLLIEVPHEDYRVEAVKKETVNSPHLSFFTSASLEMCLIKSGWIPVFTCRLGAPFGSTPGASSESSRKGSPDRSKAFVTGAKKNLVVLSRFLLPARARMFLRRFFRSRVDSFDRASFLYNSEGNILRVVAKRN